MTRMPVASVPRLAAATFLRSFDRPGQSVISVPTSIGLSLDASPIEVEIRRDRRGCSGRATNAGADPCAAGNVVSR
jgi:hypothetical protein